MFVYGWIWTIVWAFWWLIVCLGTQGMTPLLGLIGFSSLPFITRLHPRITLDVLAFAAFMIWCVASAFWSDGADSGIFTLDFSTGNLAIEAPGLRLALISVVCGFAFFALHRLPDKAMKRTRLAARIGLAILYLISVIAILDYDFIIMLTQKISTGPGFMQNIMRSLNLSVIIFPLFLCLFDIRHKIVVIGLSTIAAAGGLFLSKLMDAQAAFLAVIVVSAVSLFALVFNRLTYRLLGWITAALIMTMPLIITGVLNLSGKVARTDLPLSFVSRLESYTYVLNRIQHKWLTGWGVEASKGWKDTMKVTVNGATVDYRIVPGHPHNMGLHVWAETGIIGAVLLSVFAVLLGERLYRNHSVRKQAVIAGATIWAGALVYATLSYSLWNDAFWSAIVLSGSGVLLVSRHQDRKATQS